MVINVNRKLKVILIILMMICVAFAVITTARMMNVNVIDGDPDDLDGDPDDVETKVVDGDPDDPIIDVPEGDPDDLEGRIYFKSHSQNSGTVDGDPDDFD
jgi:hypothetical protein